MSMFVLSAKKGVLFGMLVVSGLSIMSGQAFAGDDRGNWVKFAELSPKDGSLYIDATSVKPSVENSDWREVKTLLQNESKKSSTVHAFTIDCKNMRVRKEGRYRYGQLWAQGVVVAHKEDSEKDIFHEIDDQSSNGKVMMDIYRKVCEK